MTQFKTLAIGLALSASTSFAHAAPQPTGLANLEVRHEGVGTLKAVEDWIVSFITSVAPPGRKVYYPEGQETEEEALARYHSIAKDLIAVVYSSNTAPLFKGDDGRSRTISVILSIMFHESSFMKHVDYGLGKYARGDGGKSWCMMQLKIGDGHTLRWNTAHDRPVAWNDPKSEVFEGYTGDELIADRKVCIREGLKILRLSFGGTQGLPLLDRLRVYASGKRDQGEDASHNRMRTAINWFARSFHGQFTDAEVMRALREERPESPPARPSTVIL